MSCKRLTMLAWLIIIASALASFISLFAVLHWLVGGYGSKIGSFFETVSIVLGPPATFVAGLGLLRRWRWARFYMIALLLVVVALQGKEMFFPPPSVPTTTYSPNGVLTTTFHSGPSYALPILAVAISLLAVVLNARVRSEFVTPALPVEEKKAPRNTLTRGDYDAAAEREAARGWRAGHDGRDRIFYEESNDRDWHGIQIEGRKLTGPACHVIYFASEESWQTYPAWARQRRDQIIARIKSEFPEPDYEYVVSSAEVLPPAHSTGG